MTSRSCRAIVLGLLGSACVTGCELINDPLQWHDNVCQLAEYEALTCGASVPLLTAGTCNGVREATAQCIADHSETCEQLATLMAHADECITSWLNRGATQGPQVVVDPNKLFPDNPAMHPDLDQMKMMHEDEK